MIDQATLELCALCLAGAASYAAGSEDVTLTATALARDLTDTQRADALELLHAAATRATAYLDDSDLDAGAFAAALRRHASIESRVKSRLPRSGSSHAVMQ